METSWAILQAIRNRLPLPLCPPSGLVVAVVLAALSAVGCGNEPTVRATLAHPAPVLALAYSPDGKLLVSGLGAEPGRPLEGRVLVWDTATNQEQTRISQDYWVNSLAFSPDGKLLAVGCGSYENHHGVYTAMPGAAKLYDASTFQEKYSFKHERGVFAVAFSPDGKLLATASGGGPMAPGEVKLWDVETQKELAAFKNYTADVRAVAFAPDGKTLATTDRGATQKPGVVFWEVATHKPLPPLEGDQGGVALAYSPNGKVLAVSSTVPLSQDCKT